MRTGVIYARYSEGPHQTDQSIEGQVADCMAYAAREGIQVIEVYADRHVSGKSTAGRGEFLRMIDDARLGRFDCCIVWKVDRFGRDRRDIAIYKYKLKEAGVKLLYAEESVPDGPEGIILESVLEGLAEYYSADLRQKVMRGLRESAKKGEWTYDLPIGYTKDADRRIVVDMEKAELVREAFRLHIAGATTAELQEHFTSHGVTGQRGGKISAGAIFRMLRNEKYTGRFEVQGVLVPAEPIIDEATFMEASKHFKTSRNNAAGKAKTEYLLSCTCYCGYCGRMLTGDAGHGKSGKVYNYYKCKNKDCTELKPVPKDRLEEVVLYATLRDMLTDEMIDQLTNKILEIQEKEEAASPAASFKRQLDSNRKKQQNLIAAVADGAGTGSVLIKRLKELEAEEHELEGKIAELEVKKPPLTRELISAWLNSFKAGDVEDPAFQRRLLDTFVSRVDVKNGEARVFYNVSGEGSDTLSVVELPTWKPNTTEMISRDFIVHHFYF